MGRGVSYANYRQRLEVKTFAFVNGDKALPGLVGDIIPQLGAAVGGAVIVSKQTDLSFLSFSVPGVLPLQCSDLSPFSPRLPVVHTTMPKAI